MSQLPIDTINTILKYLPFYYFKNIIKWNTYYRHYYHRYKFRQFPFLIQDNSYQYAFLTRNTNILENKYFKNLVSLIIYYKRLSNIYTILFENNKKNIHPIIKYKFIKNLIYRDGLLSASKKNLFSIQKDLSLELGFANQKNNYSIMHYTFKHIIENRDILANIHYFVINNTFYDIKGWTTHLAKIKYHYQISKQFIDCLILLIGEHINKYVYISDIHKYNIKQLYSFIYKKKKKNLNYTDYCNHKDIYCSGITSKKKKCRIKIKYSQWKKNPHFKCYCPYHKHQYTNNLLESPTFIYKSIY